MQSAVQALFQRHIVILVCIQNYEGMLITLVHCRFCKSFRYVCTCCSAWIAALEVVGHELVKVRQDLVSQLFISISKGSMREGTTSDFKLCKHTTAEMSADVGINSSSTKNFINGKGSALEERRMPARSSSRTLRVSRSHCCPCPSSATCLSHPRMAGCNPELLLMLMRCSKVLSPAHFRAGLQELRPLKRHGVS